MHARVATFTNDPANLDRGIDAIRGSIESGDIPPELEDANFLMLVDRESGKVLGVTLFESEEAMRRGDEVMNSMPGEAGSRSTVEFFEVPISTLG